MNEKQPNLGIKKQNFPGIEISILITVALGLRFFFTDFDIPLSFDALSYFSFSYETIIQGHTPELIPFTNLGWPIFVTLFFSIFSFDSAIEYMNLQKIVSITLSSLTIIPIYLLCRKFTERKYALFGSSLFIFEPRIIQNSILGITDALYLFMMTIVFVLFFNNEKKYTYAAFGLSALTTLVRSEGVFVFIAISILFFIKFNNEEKSILKYLIGFGIFVLILSPVITERIELFQNEFLLESSTELEPITKNEQTVFHNITIGIENFVKLLGWTLIPTYLIFLVSGFLIMIKKWKRENIQIIIPIIVMTIPIFYAYSIPAQDTRYLFVLFPFFSIIGAFFMKSIGEKMQNIGKILPIVIVIVIITSSIFLLEKIDSIHKTESYMISKYLVENVQGVNRIYPEGEFIRASEVLNDFPKIPYKDSSGEYTHKMKVFDINENSLDEFILKYRDKGLSHIIVDENSNRNEIFYNVFKYEQNYPFLEKIFDTKNLEWNHHFKIFKINYNEFGKE